MKNINITVENKRAAVVGSPMIICGNSDYTVTFAFDNEWSLTGPKTARFVYVKHGEVMHEDVVFDGNTVAVPVLSDVTFVNVGVFAGDLCTTTPARVNCHPSILCGSGIVQAPTPDVYAQIMTLFEEMAEKGSFGATEEQMQLVEQNRQDIAALEVGTKKAGDANKLGGHGAEYFVNRGESLTTSILEKALEVPTGVYFYHLGGSAYTGNDLPNGAWVYGSAMIVKRGVSSLEIVLFVESAPTLAINAYDGAKWSGWGQIATTAELAKYLPLTGGYLSGNLYIKSEKADQLVAYLQNSLRRGGLMLTADGSLNFYDYTNGKNIVESTVAGTNTFNGTATGNLPNDSAHPTNFYAGTLEMIGQAGIAFYKNGDKIRQYFTYSPDADNLVRYDANGLNMKTMLDTGNMASHVLPLSGGRITSPSNPSPLNVKRENSDTTYILFEGKSGSLGALGYNGVDVPTVYSATMGAQALLHTGNSARVHIGTSAPSDTTSVWFDTSSL